MSVTKMQREIDDMDDSEDRLIMMMMLFSKNEKKNSIHSPNHHIFTRYITIDK